MRIRILPFLVCSLALAACDDSSTKGSGSGDVDAAAGGAGGSGGGGGGTGGVGGATEPPMDAGLREDAAPPEPAFVEIEIDPRLPLYTLADTATVRATVYDRIGDEIPTPPMSWTVTAGVSAGPAPGELEGTDRAQRTLSFIREGQGAVRACATPDVCGRVSFFVDDGPALLELDSPTRGQLVVGEDPTIEVVGRTDPGGEVAVFLNDRPVDVEDDGSFATTIRAEFGLNRIDVIADDGVRRPPSRIVMDVLWAPEVIPVDGLVTDLGEALVLRISQRLLDARTPPPPPDDMGVTVINDIAGLLEALVARVDLFPLLPSPVLAEGDPLDLRVTAIRPPEADATLLFTDTGLDIFLRLTDLEIDTAGGLSFEGENVSLNGTISASAAGFVLVGIEAGPGGSPRLRVESADVAIEGIRGDMQDSTAQAVLDTFGSLLRTVLESFAQDLVDDLVREQVPEFIELGLDDVITNFQEFPIDVEALDGAVSVQLDLGFRLSEPATVPRNEMTLTLAGEVRQRVEPDPPHPPTGVPAQGVGDPPGWPANAGLAVAVRLSAVNALLHEVWRQGALTLDAGGILPEQVAALIDGARIDARMPPVVVATPPGSPYFFELQAGEIDLYANSPRNPEPDRYALSIRAGLILTVDNGAITFGIAEQPDIRAVLLDAGGERPVLPEDALGQLIASIAWPQLSEAIGTGLSVSLPELRLGPETYGVLAPGVEDIHILADFPADPLVRNGWFVLPAGVEVRLTDTPDP